jgi:hypothetical protein
VSHMAQYGSPVHLMIHVGGVGCEMEGVYTIRELCVSYGRRTSLLGSQMYQIGAV